jgi:hypothetical protein
MSSQATHLVHLAPSWPTDNPAGDSRLGKVLGDLQFVVYDVLERGTINPRWPELEPLWRAAKSLRADGEQLHERLGVVFVAVFLCHELDGARDPLDVTPQGLPLVLLVPGVGALERRDLVADRPVEQLAWSERLGIQSGEITTQAGPQFATKGPGAAGYVLADGLPAGFPGPRLPGAGDLLLQLLEEPD